MRIRLHKTFIKQFLKRRPAEQSRFRERRNLFLVNHFHPLLNNHVLHGKYAGYRSFSVGGDLSVIYKEEAKDLVTFIVIGTHHELYGL
ncbi:MAG: type II toxin-antitoxin system mRNA interferase toxin, RelE/StbE family [Patescibacteria group bacterium]